MLTAANKSQNISETPNLDQNLPSASTEEETPREKLKDFLESRHNKKIKEHFTIIYDDVTSHEPRLI